MSKQKLVLKFKPSDFDGSYMLSDTCAITKALARAGFPHLYDCGTSIDNRSTFEPFISYPDKRYVKLSIKVINIYEKKRSGIEIKPFQFTLEY